MLLEVQQLSGETPQALRDRPTLPSSAWHHSKAFNELSAARSIGEYTQPISQEALTAYVIYWRIDSDEERETLFTRVRRMDAAYLNHAYEKIKQSNSR